MTGENSRHRFLEPRKKLLTKMAQNQANQFLAQAASNASASLTVNGTIYGNCQQSGNQQFPVTCSPVTSPGAVALDCAAHANVLTCNNHFTGQLANNGAFTQQTGRTWPGAQGLGMRFVQNGAQTSLFCSPTGPGQAVCQPGGASLTWACNQNGTTVDCSLPIDYTYQMTGNNINLGSYEPKPSSQGVKSYAETVAPLAPAQTSMVGHPFAWLLLIVIIVVALVVIFRPVKE